MVDLVLRKLVKEKQIQFIQVSSRMKYNLNVFYNSYRMDLKRTIIILMALACVINLVGVIHCYLNYSYNSSLTLYQISYGIIFPICMLKNSNSIRFQYFIIFDCSI